MKLNKILICFLSFIFTVVTRQSLADSFLEAHAQLMQKTEYTVPYQGFYRNYDPLIGELENFYAFFISRQTSRSISQNPSNKQKSLRIQGYLIVKPDKIHPIERIEAFGELSPNGEFLSIGVVKFAFVKSSLRLKGNCYCKLDFTTSSIDGISYQFAGEFYPVAKRAENAYIYLNGVLTKFKNGIRVAQSSSRYHIFGYE
jgi:hypothetical protein